MGVAERLKDALELRGRSIRSFQQALREREVPGSSYASVHAYFGGKTPPPLEFLEAAAEELEVRRAWLLAGEGAPTEETEEYRQQVEGMMAEAGEEIRDAIAAEFPPFRSLDPYVRASVLWLWRHAMPPIEEAHALTPTQILRGTGEKVGRSLRAPLEALGIEPDALTLHQAEAYTMAAAHAFTLLYYGAGTGPPPQEDASPGEEE